MIFIESINTKYNNFIMQQKERRAYKHDIYKKIAHAERINLIYENTVHKTGLRRIARQIDFNYCSVRFIVEAYK